MKATIFIQNSAIEGGAIHTLNKIPFLQFTNIFLQNTAIFGPKISSFPLQLGLIIRDENTTKILRCRDDSESNQCKFTETAPGQTFQMVFCLLDVFGQIMTQEIGYAFVEMFSSNDTSNSTEVKGVKTAKIQEGLFFFSSLLITGTPNVSVSLKIKTDLITMFHLDFLAENNFHRMDFNTLQYYFKLETFLRPCQKGEIYIKDIKTCYKCPEGQYSWDSSEDSCKFCLPHSHCFGGDETLVDEGYWRSRIDSYNIYRCNPFSQACLGQHGDFCLEGYTGIICGACVFDDENKYFKKGLNYCEKCENLWIYILCALILLVFVLRFLWVMISEKKEDKSRNILIKLVTTHFQTLAFVSNINFNLVTMPDFLLQIVSFQVIFINVDSGLSLAECFRNFFGCSSIFIFKILLSIFSLFAIVFFVIIFWLIRGKILKFSADTIKFNIVNTFLVVMSFLQASFINFYLQNLSCDLYDNVKYLTINLNQVCWNWLHITFSVIFTIPLLIFFIGVYPLVILHFLYFKFYVLFLVVSSVH